MRRHLLFVFLAASLAGLSQGAMADDETVIAVNTVQDGTVSDISLASDFTGGVGASQSDPSGVTIQMIQQINANTTTSSAPSAAPYARSIAAH